MEPYLKIGGTILMGAVVLRKLFVGTLKGGANMKLQIKNIKEVKNHDF